MMWLNLINIVCGIVIFLYCACRLGGRQWSRWSLEFFAHVILLTSAVAIFTAPPASLEILVFRVGVALYFATQIWCIWRLQRRIAKYRKAKIL